MGSLKSYEHKLLHHDEKVESIFKSKLMVSSQIGESTNNGESSRGGKFGRGGWNSQGRGNM